MTESDLSTLLSTLAVHVCDGVWTFETAVEGPDSSAIMTFREREGWTAIKAAHDATSSDNRWVWLELTVYSDLNAVGFLARIAAALAEAGVPCNAVAAFHHDHIFVPEDKADLAIRALEALQAQATAPK
ncbi:MAG: ACT domain-containing protein [Pseudomonadota bacterium]